MADQFDVSESERRNLLEKAKRRAVLRAEFLKQSTNPFRHASMEGGTVFDAGIQRFGAMRVTSYEHWRPTAKNLRGGLLTVVIPMLLFGYALKTTRDSTEEKLRNGEVAYSERRFKFI